MALKWLNVALAVMALIAVLGSIAVMDKGTRNLIRAATILIAGGLFGQAFGVIFGQWGDYADTLLFGGLAMLVLASRRVPTCWLERQASPVSWGICAATLALAIVPGLVHAADGRGDVFRGLGQNGQPTALRLHDTACTHPKIVAALAENLLDARLFKRATLTWQGRDWAICWAERKGTVYSVDEEGSPFQPISRPLFRNEAI